MGKVNDIFRQHQLETLEVLKKRRAILDNNIGQLEYAIEHPSAHINIDFEAIREEVHKDIEFLEKCEKVRKGEWIDS